MRDHMFIKPSKFTSLYELLQYLVILLVIMTLTFVFVGRHFGVKGPSMTPTVVSPMAVITSKLFYEPKYKDLIVFMKYDYDPKEPLIKRVIATEGQLVDIDYDIGIVYVNGEALDEPYINERMIEPSFEMLDFPLTIPEGSVLAMGDNRNYSNDSRDVRLGLVLYEEIVGRAYAVIWPISEWKLL